jgi:hypothetical protein
MYILLHILVGRGFILRISSIFRGNSYWIPAFAGMTKQAHYLSFRRKPESRKGA